VFPAALRKFEHDLLTPDHIKVHECMQILGCSLKSLRMGGSARPMAPPGYLTSSDSSSFPPTLRPADDAVFTPFVGTFEPRMVLTTSQQQYEAKANAERVLAVQMMINPNYGTKVTNDKGGKGADKKGGGKKGKKGK
jgi:hypothetical protein